MTANSTDRSRARRSVSILVGPALSMALILVGCGTPRAETPTATEAAAPAPGGSFAITAWGSHYEVFPEIGNLVAGQPSTAHTHVTALADFSPLAEGVVEIVLSGPGGEQVFSASEPTRPGVFDVTIEPRAPAAGSDGVLDLAFRIRSAAGSEQIRGGRVRIGTAEKPGGLVVAPAPRGATEGGEPLDFLKEEQWRSDFATTWVRNTKWSASASGLARLRPPAGGEVWITAPIDGVLMPAGAGTWPHAGLGVEKGAPLFRIAPRVANERSLASLEADVTAFEVELAHARERSGRLRELFDLEATSQRSMEEAEVEAKALEARYGAALRDLEAARAVRQNRDSGAGGSVLRASFAGEIARVEALPGATVEAGAPLARLVRTDRTWLEVAVSPGAVRAITSGGLRGVVLIDPEMGAVRLEEGVRLVSVAPELSAETGTLSVLVEVPEAPGLALGSLLDARLLSATESEAIVIPASARVDDGGVDVVYLQLAGESFVRQPIRVLDSQGDRLRVEGLIPGQRLVESGGAAIRRASLMAGGAAAHGHVH